MSYFTYAGLINPINGFKLIERTESNVMHLYQHNIAVLKYIICNSWAEISNTISEDNCLHLFIQRGLDFELDINDPAAVTLFSQ